MNVTFASVGVLTIRMALKSDNSDWIINCGTSHYLSGDRKQILSIRPFSDVVMIYLGDGLKISAKGSKTIHLNLLSQKIAIEALYGPKL